MADRGTEVVVAGHICLDMLPEFTGAETTLASLLTPGKLINMGPLLTATGGSVSNTGIALHRLGFRTQLMGKVGDDTVGRAILEILGAHDPALADAMVVVPGHPSSYTIVINPPGVDRVFLHHPGANDTFAAEDIVLAEVTGARLFHFGYPPLMRRMYLDDGAELADLLARVKQCGPTLSLDMARPDPESEAGRVDWRKVLARALPHVDVFLPSFDETLFMLDRKRFDEIAGGEDADLNAAADGPLLRRLSDELLDMGAALVGLKLGTQGFYLRTSPDRSRLAASGPCAPSAAADWLDRELLAPCFEVEAVGTTGSGDCTIAGFLGGLLRGLPPEGVMTAAVAVGACNVERADATSGVPAWEAVQERTRARWKRRPVTVALAGWEWSPDVGAWRSPHDSG